MHIKHLSPPIARLLLTVLGFLAFGAASLRAEEVYVTSGRNNEINGWPPSGPYGLQSPYIAYHFSTACTNERNCCVCGATKTAGWLVTPRLANSHGIYKIFVTKPPASDCSPDIIVNMTTTGGTLADASGTAQTTVPTTAFQAANSTNTWTLVGYITNNTTQPDVTFTYASGAISASSRWYMDAVAFQSIADPAPPARITQILHNNTVTISGTGPVNHPFALVSSTNAAKALNQWTPEKTNTDGTGAFTFSITPGAAKARFFRVITQ